MSQVLDFLAKIWENPWVHGGVVAFVVMTTAMLSAAMTIWFERKWTGMMQNRPGPTERGPAPNAPQRPPIFRSIRE